MEKESKKYEIGFLAKSEDGKEEVVKVLNGHKTEAIESGNFSRIKLAYPVKKENFAYFGYIYFSSQPSIISKIKDDLKLNAQILRFLIVTPPVIKPVLSAIPQKDVSNRFVSVKQTSVKPKIEVKKAEQVLTNEALEKKLEEILK